MKLGVINDVVKEPLGGAHRGKAETIEDLGDVLETALTELMELDGGLLRERRRENFLDMGKKSLS